jgi:predicted metal-dependent TIM-barrel fold hydrolase
MRIFEPHAHMYCRLTDDYERMGVAGITAVQEPAFWLGTERTHPESFYDYFEHITVFERKRAEKYGIRHYQSIGVNPKDAENLDVTIPTVKGMRRFLERPSVVGVGEIGLNNNTPNEMVGLELQLDVAMDMKLPALVHTPHVDKRRGVEMIKGLLERRGDYDRSRILIDHITEETIDIVRDMGVWVAMTVYPFSKLSPERAVAMVAKYGLERIMVNSSVDWGESDPLSVPKVVRLMRREGWKERDIEQLVWRNPVRFWSQSGRLAEAEVPE